MYDHVVSVPKCNTWIVALHIYKEKRHEGFVPIFNVPLINFYLFCQNIHIKLPVGNINQTTYNRIVLFSWLKKRIVFITTVILFCNASNNRIIKNTLMSKCKVDLFIQTMRLENIISLLRLLFYLIVLNILYPVR